jgi:macrolide-specific efflux system membrane fusion protein
MKKWLITIGVFVLGGLVWLGVRGGKPPEKARAANDSVIAQRRNIDVAVDAIGEVNPAYQVTVKAEVNGRIRTVEVVTGQTVKRTELLIALDDTDLLTERAAAQTEIAGAQVQLNKAQRDYERNDHLFASRLVSQEVIDNAKTTHEMAQNAFEKAQRQLQTVEDKLKKVRIAAPFDGTVLTVPVSKGQVVSGATGASQGTDLMTFADLNELVIRAHNNQVDVTKVQPGQAVTITVDSIPGVTCEGKVVLIAPIATIKNGIKGFSVDTLITRGDVRIRPGMNANLKFPVAHVEAALAVPLTAVFAEEKDKAVYVKAPRGLERRVVTVGASDYNFCEITSGLKEGETVSLERPAQPQSKS